MDLALKALCQEVLEGNVDSERFAWLLVETKINLDSHEWDIANHLLQRGDAMNSLAMRYGQTLH